MKKFFKLIRYPYLIVIFIIQALIHFGFIKGLQLPHALLNWQFLLLALATICIAAAGFINLSLANFDAGKSNAFHFDKKLSANKGFNLYLALNFAGVGLGFLVAYLIGKNSYATFLVMASALLYVYAQFLQHILVIRGLVAGILVAFIAFIVIVFDLLPVLSIHNLELTTPIVVLRDFAVFLLLFQLLYGLVDDINDLDGDHTAGSNTIPLNIGRDRTAKMAAVYAIALIFLIIGYIYINMYGNILISAYLLFIVCGSLLFFAIKAWAASSPIKYEFLAKTIKVIMLLAIFSLAILTISLNYAN